MSKLADDLERQIGQRTNTRIVDGKKRGNTLITKDLVSAVRADELGIIEIRQDNTKAIEQALNRAIMEGLEEIGINAEGIASDNAPYDTGRLAASITHALDADEQAVYIGTNVEYAAVQELGNSSGYKGANGGKGYLRLAATENMPMYKAIMRKHLENG